MASSTSPLTFTGISQFSSDYQTILNRAVQIAQIPVQALQNQDSVVLQKQTLLGNLNTSVAALTSSLTNLGNLAANNALGATSSNSSVVSVTNSGATSPATYTINSITSAAAAASERSTNSFATANAPPVSSTGTLKLVVGSNNYTFTLANNNLNALRDKINSLGAGVTASVLTTSSTSNYLSITANATGATTLQLFDDPSGANTNLLTSSNQGTNAVFQLNGINVSQAGNVVNAVVPGLTFTILGSSSSPVTLTLASDRTQLQSALQSFVSSYNTLATQLNAQVGTSAGPLSGDTAIVQLSNALRQLTSYRGSSGSVRSLADLGIQFSSSGQASLDTSVFGGLSDTQIADGLSFIGSATKGFGGFSQTFDQFSNSISGSIQSEQKGLGQTDQDLQKQITTLNDRITLLQNGLTAKLQQADAAVAQLQTQQTEISAILLAQNSALYGTSTNQSSGSNQLP